MEGTCVLCKQEEETKDHLSFSCIFSQQIWKEVILLCGLSKGGFKSILEGSMGKTEA